MTSILDFAGKLLDFLKNPTGLAVLLVGLIFLFLIYTIPIGLVTYFGIHNTQELKTVSKENTQQVVTAIRSLQTCIRCRETETQISKKEQGGTP